MTEHFTSDGAVALAKNWGKVTTGYRLDNAKPYENLEITVDRFKCALETAVAAKLKEWEAQGAVAEVRESAPIDADGTTVKAAFLGDTTLPAGTKLYTHALPAQPAEPVNAELVGMLAKARAGLSSGLWDYGPGQDEHEQCNELIEEIDALLSRAQAAPGVGVSDGYVTKEDAELLAHVIEQFEDCGETDVDDKTLMRFAAMGLLECTRFEATVKGHEIAAKTDAPLFASAQPQQKEG